MSSFGVCDIHLIILLFLDVYHAQEKDLVIDCKVRANPRPVVTWQKDNLPIEFDERMQQIEHLDGVCELIIHQPTVKDSGLYQATGQFVVVFHLIKAFGKI